MLWVRNQGQGTGGGAERGSPLSEDPTSVQAPREGHRRAHPWLPQHQEGQSPVGGFPGPAPPPHSLVSKDAGTVTTPSVRGCCPRSCGSGVQGREPSAEHSRSSEARTALPQPPRAAGRLPFSPTEAPVSASAFSCQEPLGSPLPPGSETSPPLLGGVQRGIRKRGPEFGESQAP